MAVIELDGVFGTLYVSTTTGASWTPMTSAGTQSWASVVVSPNGNLIAATVTGGDIWLSTTTGQSWTDVSSPGSHNWNSIAASADGSVLLASYGGGSGRLWMSTSTGATWTNLSTPGNGDWSNVTMTSDASFIAATISDGDMWVSTTTGATWTDRGAAGAWDFANVSSSGNLLAAFLSSNFGDLFLSGDKGVNWTDLSGDNTRVWKAFTSSADGSKLVAAAGPMGALSFDIYTALLDSPSASVSSPSSGATVSGASVTLQATASDAATSTESMTFYIDNVSVGSVTGASPYSMTWDSTSAANGSHSLIAVVKSAAGTYATSSSMSFTVHNAPAQTLMSSGLPWCSSPDAPGWDKNLPDGGCGAAPATPPVLPPITPVQPSTQSSEVIASSTLDTVAPPAPAPAFGRNLKMGMSGKDVIALQKYLNSHGFVLTHSGPGSPGNESSYFGKRTVIALYEFQYMHAADILTPQDETQGSGELDTPTRAFINSAQ